MGILNVTPDSFSDGGQFLDVSRAVDRALEMAAQGADLIDIGGESTRPNATPVPEEEELRRVMPVLERLAGRLEVPVSIDTMKPAVARAALEAGVSIVNDVAANREDPEMLRVAAGSGAAYVCMHMRGTPQTMQSQASYENVVHDVERFFEERIPRLFDCGLGLEQVILDPGIGFGKSPAHNLKLLGGLRSFSRFGRPLLIGVSRKSFIGRFVPVGWTERLPGSLACACLAVASGAAILRVHDVPETIQAVRIAEAILAASPKQT